MPTDVGSQLRRQQERWRPLERLRPPTPRPLEPLPLYMSLLQDTNKLPSHLPPHRHRLLITRGPFWPRLRPTPCLHICSRPLLLPRQPLFSLDTPK